MRGPHVRFCERDKAGTDHSGLTLLDFYEILTLLLHDDNEISLKKQI